MKKRFIIYFLGFLFLFATSYFLIWQMEVVFLHKKGFQGLRFFLVHPQISKKGFAMVCLLFLFLVSSIWYLAGDGFSNGTQRIAGKIIIPKARSSSEYGSARFATDAEKKKMYRTLILDANQESLRELIRRANQRNETLEQKYQQIYSFEKERESLETKIWSCEEEKISALKKLSEKKEKILDSWQPSEDLPTVAPFFEAKNDSGIVLNYEKKGQLEEIKVMNEDRHHLLIGTSRSGKGRNYLLPSIATLSGAGENLLVVDPKGENFLYTSDFLSDLGYQIITLDFREPQKSMHYNFLQGIIDLVNQNELAEAINACWDMTAQLVGEAKGEKIWNNGEASVIAGSIMAVVYDNRSQERRKYQNLTNVYYFIVNSSQMVNEEQTLLTIYEESLPYDHPSKALFGIAKAAPRRTMGSFTTSALATLKLFTNPYIYQMTRNSDFSISELAREKTAVFLILPDEKKTYHSVATLFVTQFYQHLIGIANRYGGRLATRYNFLMDEFGNFPKITDLDSILTAGAGRGIRLSLILQDFAQLEKNYGREEAKIVQNNAEIWLYLKSDDTETIEKISKRLGNYTIYNISKSKNYDKNAREGGGGISANLAGRELLKPEEIAKIDRPYALLLHRGLPMISFSPDLSQWVFNQAYGLGDQRWNQKILMVRNFKRKEVKTAIKIEVSHPFFSSEQEEEKSTFAKKPVKTRTKEEYKEKNMQTWNSVALFAIQQSKMFTGTQNLIKDLISAMQVISGIIAVAVLVYIGIQFMIKKEEIDEKSLKRKAIITLAALIGILLVSEIVKIIVGYYGVQVTI